MSKLGDAKPAGHFKMIFFFYSTFIQCLTFIVSAGDTTRKTAVHLRPVVIISNSNSLVITMITWLPCACLNIDVA